MGHRLDAAHNDGLEVQKLNAHALVDLECHTRRIGTVGNQTRGCMERGGIGVLVLKTAGIGNQATQQAGRNAITCDNAAIVQEAVDDHGAGCSFDAPQAELGKLLARRMVIEAHHMLGATKHLGGIIETLDDRHVHRDEQVRIAGIRRCRYQAIGAFHKAVDARNRIIVCQQQGNVLVREKLHKREAQTQHGAQGVAIGRSVSRNRNGGRTLDELEDASLNICRLARGEVGGISHLKLPPGRHPLSDSRPRPFRSQAWRERFPAHE